MGVLLYRDSSADHLADPAAESRRGRSAILTAAILLAFSSSIAALAAEARSASSGDWLWSSSSAGHRVTDAKGEALAIDLPATARLSDFAAVGDGWLATAIDPSSNGPTLQILRGDGRGSWALPSPSIAGAELRSASLAVDGKGLQGLAWLEGADSRRLAVKSASWLGHAWSAVETVAAPGPGSQLSLASAQLADGTWLLLWSAYDGTDDEILWSQRSGDGWSSPARLGADDQVPDITPRVVALANGGALAAWSGFVDGHYRLHTASFSTGRWTEPEISGGPGTVAPDFEIRDDHPYLVYRQAVPRAWVVAEVGTAGKLGRRAELRTSSAVRPLLGKADGGGIELRWAAEATKGAAVTAETARWNDTSP